MGRGQISGAVANFNSSEIDFNEPCCVGAILTFVGKMITEIDHNVMSTFLKGMHASNIVQSYTFH